MGYGFKVKISVQTDNFESLKEAVESRCSGIRFGSEFCMYNMPSLKMLKEAYDIVRGAGKEFTYITPRLSNMAVRTVEEQLPFLEEKGDAGVVFNDFGALNILRNYPRIRLRLGRQLIRMPARSPWTDRIIEDGLEMRTLSGVITVLAKGDFFAKRWYKNMFSYTSLNYSLTREFYQRYGVRDVDIDYVPIVFPQFYRMIEQGFNLSVLLHLVPVTITRRCHTARFVGEKTPYECSKRCYKSAYLLENEVFDLKFYLVGNCVFSLCHPCREDLRKLTEKGVAEFVLTMHPVTGIQNRKEIDDFISQYVE